MGNISVIKEYLAKGVQIIKQDSKGVIALSKPEGIKAHPNTDKKDEKSLFVAPYDKDKEAYIDKDGKPFFYLVHRLDSPTSGIILGALNADVADIVKLLFKEKKIKKTYHAWVKGPVRFKRTTWTDLLSRDKDGPTLRMRLGQGDRAVTHVSLLKQGRFALLKLEPLTGKTHQLRVQCAKHGCAILGDKIYGDFTVNRQFKDAVQIKRLMLHATTISFSWPNEKGTFSAEVPLPEIFKNLNSAS